MSPPAGSSPAGRKTAALVVVLLVAASGWTVARLTDDPPPAAVHARGGSEAAPTTAVAGTGGQLTPEQSRAIEKVKSQVSAVRGLAWKAPLSIRIVSRADLADRVRRLNEGDRATYADDIEATAKILKILGLVPEDFDYGHSLDELLSGSVLGYYDDQSKELFVGGEPGQELSLSTRETLAHELTHALTDQHFDFGARTKVLDDADRTEESFALSALVEGDATFTAALWAEANLSQAEQAALAAGEGGGGDALSRAPRYLLDALYFPYVQGVAFVRARFQAGGFPALDETYRAPPVSSENILHPATYAPGAKPPAPTLPGLEAVDGCGGLHKGSIGEFDMSEVLDLHLARAVAERAAAGWNGDTYALVECGSARGLLDRWSTDTPTDLDELVAGLGRWAGAWAGNGTGPDSEGRFSGPKGNGRIVRGPTYVDLVLASDQPTADRLVAAVGMPAPPA